MYLRLPAPTFAQKFTRGFSRLTNAIAMRE